MDKQLENKITASIWRDTTSKPITVECPSGAQIKMVRLPFSTMIKKDLIPSALVSTAIGILEGRTYIDKGREAYLRNIEVIGRYVKECVIEPMITLDESKATEDIMYIDDIPDADKLYIANVAMHYLKPIIVKPKQDEPLPSEDVEQVPTLQEAEQVIPDKPEEGTEEVSSDYKKFCEQ